MRLYHVQIENQQAKAKKQSIDLLIVYEMRLKVKFFVLLKLQTSIFNRHGVDGHKLVLCRIKYNNT